MSKIAFEQNADHVGGSFAWEKEPACCELLKLAVDDEKFVFVSNFTEGGNNLFYFMPLASDGSLARSDGVTISYCPWCGTKIQARKKYLTP